MTFPRFSNTRSLFSALILAAAAAAMPATVLAQEPQAILQFQGDQGDYISLGQSWNYTQGVQASASTDARVVSVSVYGDTWWNLYFSAPAGQQLVPGVYEGAVRYPFQDDAQPGLSLSGDGRGCNTLTGRFEVTAAEYGPFGTIVRFAANFEQHCEGGVPGLYGEVSITNPPPAPALTVDIVVNNAATVRRHDGRVTVTGTVTCSRDTVAQINGTSSQRANRFNIAQGSFNTTSACSTTPTTWTASFASNTGVPFNQGQAQVDATAGAYDSLYGAYATDAASTVVNLRRVAR